MQYSTKVEFEWTDNATKAIKWLNSLPNMFAADFEVASRYSRKEKDLLEYRYSYVKDEEQKRLIHQKLISDGLSYPAFTCITHLSIAWSSSNAYVIICDNDYIRHYILKFLVETDKLQLWHNSVFDFEHIYYNTGKIPKNFIDTQLLAKSLLNDAKNTNNDTRLKTLMAYAYGQWAISKDEFTLEDMRNETMLKYSATDSCATFKLYEDIIQEYGELK